MYTSNPDPNPNQITDDSYSHREYESTGKFMLIAIIVLFFVIVLLIALHFYARWYIRRAAARRRRTRRRSNIFLDIVIDDGNEGAVAPTRGLCSSLLSSLPVFVFSDKAGTCADRADCAVCLSEFEKNELARELPKCGHVFHVDCIDMWFRSHDTCPLCRAPVEPVDEPEKPVEVSITVPDPVASSGSDLYETCRDEESGTSSSNSTSSESKQPIAIEIPERNSDGFGNESSTRADSTASHRTFRSPIRQMLSLKRILSRERKTTPSPSTTPAVTPRSNAGGSVAEPDIEKGIVEAQ